MLSSAPATLTKLTSAAQGEVWVLLGPSAWSHFPALGCSAFLLVSENAERKLLGSNLSLSPAAPLEGRSLTLFTKPHSCGARLRELGCWLGSVPSSGGFQTPACLSQIGQERGSQSPPTEAKSRISPDFYGRAVYFQRAALAASPNCPFSLPPPPVKSEPCVVASPAFPWRQTLTSQAWAVAPGTVISL